MTDLRDAIAQMDAALGRLRALTGGHIARARAYMAAHGWRDDMGAEVGLLLIRAYERGRDDESAARGGIRIHEEQT